MTVNDIIIKFVDGETLKIDNAETYSLESDLGVYIIAKNGCRIFINAAQVKYVGRKFGLEAGNEM